MRTFIITFICGLGGGAIFQILHLPLPWILGPAAAIMVLNGIKPGKANWPRGLSDVGIIVIAYLLGRTMTAETVKTIAADLPGMVTAAAVWVGIGYAAGLMFSKAAKVDVSSSILGSMPGGLTQMVLMADDVKRADAGTVAIMQTCRLVVVLYTVPFLAAFFASPEGLIPPALSPSLPQQSQHASSPIHWPAHSGYFLLPTVVAAAWLFRKWRIPAGEFLGPALWVGAGAALGCPWPAVPASLLPVAQLCIGIYIGGRVQPRLIASNKRLGPLALIVGAFLVSMAALAAWLLSIWTEPSIVTWFLAVAPGGLGEVAATAIVLHADVAMVTAYQLFRLLFILLVAPPVLRWLLKAG